jgi:tetratricopeptide (TPR) repeat protein
VAWLAQLGLGTFLTAFGLGCFPQTILPLTANNSAPALPPKEKEVVPEKDQPRRQPQPSTCVAFGKLQLEAAVDSERTPAQREQMYDMARQYYQQAIKLDAHCLEAYYGLGRAYRGLGDHDREVATYQKGLRVYPQNASLWFELGMCQARSKEWGPALENLKKATALEPENRSYNSSLAYALARAGRYDESFDYFKKVVGEAQAHYNVARMLHHVKDDGASKQHLQMALRINPDFQEARQLLVELDTPGAAAGTAAATASFDMVDRPPQTVEQPPKPAAKPKKPLF